MELLLLLIPPALVLICKGPWQALLNAGLILLGVIPGLIHLWWVLAEEAEYQDTKRFVRNIKRAMRARN